MRRWWPIHVVTKSYGIFCWYSVSCCGRMKKINTFLFEKVSLSVLNALTRESRWTHSCIQGFILHFVCLWWCRSCFFWVKALSTQVMVKMICQPWLFVCCLSDRTDLQNALNFKAEHWAQADWYDWYMQIAPVSAMNTKTAKNLFSKGSADPTFLSVSGSKNCGDVRSTSHSVRVNLHEDRCTFHVF